MIPCAAEPEALLAAAWAAANVHANALDRNSQHTVTGLTAQMVMGVLPVGQVERLLSYWAWWKATWDHYGAVRARILTGEQAAFDPAVPGPCPWSIWQLAAPPPPVVPVGPDGH